MGDKRRHSRNSRRHRERHAAVGVLQPYAYQLILVRHSTAVGFCRMADTLQLFLATSIATCLLLRSENIHPRTSIYSTHLRTRDTPDQKIDTCPAGVLWQLHGIERISHPLYLTTRWNQEAPPQADDPRSALRAIAKRQEVLLPQQLPQP